MSSKKLRFRPTVQTLESRRCLAGALGMDDVGATPEEPAITVGAAMAISVGAAMANDATSQLTAILPPDTASQGKHFDPVIGVDVDWVNKDSIWMDLGYPVKAGNTADPVADDDGTNDGENYIFLSLGYGSSGNDYGSSATPPNYRFIGTWPGPLDAGVAASEADAFFSDLGDDTTNGGTINTTDGAGNTLLLRENIDA